MKVNSCIHTPTILLTSKIDDSIKFAVCNDDKKDSRFENGFTEEKI